MDYDLKLSAPWDEVKERIKEAEINITDEDLAYKPGQEEALLKRIADKLGKDVQHAKDWVESVSFTTNIAS